MLESFNVDLTYDDLAAELEQLDLDGTSEDQKVSEGRIPSTSSMSLSPLEQTVQPVVPAAPNTPIVIPNELGDNRDAVEDPVIIPQKKNTLKERNEPKRVVILAD